MESNSKLAPMAASPFPREAEYFGFCPLQLTDRFCAAVNGKLVSAVDTFQDWASMNLVRVDEVHARALLLMASQEQLNATGPVANRMEERKGVHILKEMVERTLKDYPDIAFVFGGRDLFGWMENRILPWVKDNGSRTASSTSVS